MDSNKKIKISVFISVLILIIGIIITVLLFLAVYRNNQDIKRLNESISSLENTINNLQNNKDEIIKNTSLDNTINNDEESDDNYENEELSNNSQWIPYPKDMYKKISDYFGFEFDEDSVAYNLQEKTIYGLIKKYKNIADNEFYDLYFDYGDSTRVIETDSNYSRYCYPDNENNNLSAQYTEKIKYSIAEFNEAYYDGYYSLQECVKRQYDKLVIDKEYGHYTDVPEKLYYSINSMLIMNGNNESEDDFFNNSRAKKIKITINDEKEYEINLQDTNDIQIFNIDYKQETIEHPVNIVVEVLEQYPGEKSNDIYISDVQFSIDSNIPQGR